MAEVSLDVTSEPSRAPSASQLDAREIRAIIIGVMLALLLSALDQTIVVTALPTIAVDLGGANLLSWAVSAYLLTATASTPLYGKFADIRGRRAALFVGLAIFTVGSVASALSPSMVMLILARAIQGLGAGGLMAVPMTVVGDIVAPRERGRYQGYIAVVYAASSFAGPLVGGLFADSGYWSLIFWINLPIALLAVLVAGPALRRLPRHERPHKLDFAGAGLLVSATVVTLLGLTWSTDRFGWTAAVTLELAGAALVLWLLFGLRIVRAAEPLIPIGIATNNVIASATVTAFFGFGTFIGLTVVVPLYFEVIRGASPSQSGIAVLPLMIGTTIGATITGRLMGRIEHYKRLPTAGMLVSVATMAVVATWFRGFSDLALSFAFGLSSIGIGTMFPVVTVAIQNAVEPHQMGTATALNTFFRQLGGAVIAAVYGALLLSSASAGATSAAHPVAMAGASAAAFQLVFGLVAIGIAIAFVSLSTMEERPLRGRG